MMPRKATLVDGTSAVLAADEILVEYATAWEPQLGRPTEISRLAWDSNGLRPRSARIVAKADKSYRAPPSNNASSAPYVSCWWVSVIVRGGVPGRQPSLREFAFRLTGYRRP